MAQGHVSCGHSFEKLMASLRGAKSEPQSSARPVVSANTDTTDLRSPIERMQEANRRLQEATARLKQSSHRLEYSVSNLQAAVAQLLEKYPELRHELPDERMNSKK
jgi:division protein CdvB (Snf7/Vps24/ESCRT-III family)